MSSEVDNIKYLMPLPSHARLFVSGCEMPDKSGYLMDKDNIIYFYSDELQAAVESLNSYACDSSGKEIRFFFIYAKRNIILSCKDALSKLSA